MKLFGVSCFHLFRCIPISESTDARPMTIWPFSTQITSLSYDTKHEHLAVGLRSGNVCIIERTNGNLRIEIKQWKVWLVWVTLGVNDLPTVQHIGSVPALDIHALDSHECSLNMPSNQKKHNGFFVLSDDGRIYRVKFKPILPDENMDEQQHPIACFPPYVHTIHH